MTLLKRLRSGWEAERALSTLSAARADRHRITVEAFGDSKPLTEWEADSRMRVSPETFVARISEGWNSEEALTAESEAPRVRARSPQKLYFGKPIAHWLRDPRCLVSRATLLRNFEIGLPLEEALQYRIQTRSEEPSLVAETVHKALDLMALGGEIWRYKEFSHSRISLILGGERYDISDAILADLTAEGYVQASFSSSNLTMYQLRNRSLK